MSLASLKRIGAYALVLVGVATVVVFSALSFHPSRAGATSRSPSGSDTSPLASGPSSAFSCTVLSSASAANESLRQAQTQARTLLDRGETTEALSRLRSIAAADAGLPGINLDLSTALLKARQTEAAKSAINAQLGASECLARMTPDAVDAYCKAQFKQATGAGCRQELAAIERSSHFQSALVQMALANSLGGASALDTEDTGGTLRPERRPAARVVASVPLDEPVLKSKAVSPRPKAAKNPSERGNPLAAGAGTDAALGAYSK